MQQGRWEEAEKIFAGAVKCCPSDERAQSCYAEALWRRGACEQAIAHMTTSAELSGNDPQRLVQLGEMHLAVGQTDRAAQCASTAISKNCRLSSAWSLKGDVAMAKGRLDESLADYHRSLAYAEHQPRVQLAIAQIYRRQQRPQRALSTLETLAEQYPPGEVPVDVIALQGMSLKQLGRHADAAQMLAKATQMSPPSADLLFQLAEAQFQSGDASAAQATLQLALTQDPQHVGGRNLLATMDGKQQSLTARAMVGREYK